MMFRKMILASVIVEVDKRDDGEYERYINIHIGSNNEPFITVGPWSKYPVTESAVYGEGWYTVAGS